MVAILGGLVWFSGFLALAGMAFATSTSTPWTLRVGTLVQGAGVALASIGLVVYVRSEDSYRDNGTSRWDAYGAHQITVEAAVLGAVAVAVLVGARVIRRRGFAIGAFLTSIVAALMIAAATLANSLN